MNVVLRNWRPMLARAVFAAENLLLPELVKRGTPCNVIMAQYLAIFAMSRDFLSGRTGYINSGHPFLIGIGAHATAILSHRFDVPFAVSIPAAVLASGLFILPALRIRGACFALVSLAFIALMYPRTPALRPHLTGSRRGTSRLETLTRGAVPGVSLLFGLMVAAALLLWSQSLTRLGTGLAAIGMNEDAVAGSGLDTTCLKLVAIGPAAAAAGAGLCGAFRLHRAAGAFRHQRCPNHHRRGPDRRSGHDHRADGGGLPPDIPARAPAPRAAGGRALSG